MNQVLTGIGIKIQGHLKIIEYKSYQDYLGGRPNQILLNKRNAIHKDHAAVLLAKAITNKNLGAVCYMVFGNGGASIDGTGTVIFNPPNDTNPSANLYNPTFFQMVDDTLGALPGNSMAVRHISNYLFSDADIRCLIPPNQPFGQVITNMVDGINLNDNSFAFNEIGLKTIDGTLITHVTFTPVLKHAEALLEVIYTLRVFVSGEPSPPIPPIPVVNFDLIGLEVTTEIGILGSGLVPITGVQVIARVGEIGGLGITWQAFHTGFRWREDSIGTTARYGSGTDDLDNFVMGNNTASAVDGSLLFAMDCDAVSDAVDTWFGSPLVIRAGTYQGNSQPAFTPICQGQYILAVYQAGSPHSVSSETYKWFVLLDPVSTATNPVCLGAVAYNGYVTAPPYLALYSVVSTGSQGVNDPILLFSSNDFGGNQRSLVPMPSPAEITSGVYKLNGFNQSYPYGAGYPWEPCEVPLLMYGIIGGTTDLSLYLYQQNDGGMFSLPGPSGGTNLYFYFNKTYTHFNLYTNSLLGATIATPGTGYILNQWLQVVGGTYDEIAQVQVIGVDGFGAVTNIQVNFGGGRYWIVPPGSPLATTGGSGTGFTFNPTWGFNGSPYIDIEIANVIAPLYPDGSIIKIVLSTSQMDFDLIAQNAVNNGTPHDGCAIDGTGATPMYTIDNANWQNDDTTPAIPFDDEWTIITTGSPGGSDVYPPIPAATIDNGDGTWTVDHLIWGNSDGTMGGNVRPAALRKFVYDPTTSVAIQESRTADRLYTNTEAPQNGADFGGVVHYEADVPYISGYHDFQQFFGPSGGITFRSTFGTRSTIHQKNVGGANFTGTQTVIMNSPSGLPSDNGKGTLSFWYNRGVYSGGSYLICGEPNDNTPLYMRWNYSHHFQLGFKDPTGTKTIIYDTPTGGFIPPVGNFNEWCHFIFSWDMNFLPDPRTSGSNPPQMLFLVDRGNRSLNRTVVGTTKWKLDYTAATSYRFFTEPVTPHLNEFSLPIGNLQGDIAEFWFAPGVFMDVTDPEILNNWVSPDQGGGVFHPARLGTNGELPLAGIIPFVYFSCDPNASAFTTNLGYGGAATLTGTLTDSSTSP